MSREMHVCTLEQSNVLKSLGTVQKSLFYHVNGDVITDAWRDAPSAYTASELGILLLSPRIKYQGFWGIAALPDYCTERGVWFWRYGKSLLDNGFLHEIIGDTEAQCRASILIYLITNNIILSPKTNT